MEYGAIDLHKKESQIRILREGGEIIDRRIATTRDRSTAVFWGRPRMRALNSTRSEGRLDESAKQLQPRQRWLGAGHERAC